MSKTAYKDMMPWEFLASEQTVYVNDHWHYEIDMVLVQDPTRCYPLEPRSPSRKGSTGSQVIVALAQPESVKASISTILAQCARMGKGGPISWEQAWIMIDAVTWDMDLNPASKRVVGLAVQVRLMNKGVLLPHRPRMATLHGNAARDYSTWGKRFREMLNHNRKPKKMGRVTKAKREHLEDKALVDALSIDLENI